MTRIQDLIAATLAAGLAGCTTTWNCDPDDEQFIVDEVLTEKDVTVMVANWGLSDSSQLECEDVCRSVYEKTTSWAATEVTSCTMSLTDEGGDIRCEGAGIEYYCEGRRPLGHLERPADGSDLGAHLAGCAHLEAASVTAFAQLADWLAARGAPRPLIDRCRQAAAEEQQHAAAVSALARAHGAEVHPPRCEPAEQTLLAVALHNATEGCVFEAWAALVAALHADRAQTGMLRALYAPIAREEAAHGQLAWDLHGWLMGQLSAEEQAQVVAAQQQALRRLPRIARGQAARAPAALRMPHPEQAAALARRFAAGLAA